MLSVAKVREQRHLRGWGHTNCVCRDSRLSLEHAGQVIPSGMAEWLTNPIVWVALWCNDSCPINWISRGLSGQWRTCLLPACSQVPPLFVHATVLLPIRASASNFRLEHYVKYKNSLVHALKCHMHCNPRLLSPPNEAGHSRQTLSIIQTLCSSPWLGNLLPTKDKQTLTQRVK